MGWKVKFFQTSRGGFPVKEFIESQDVATYAKFLKMVRLLVDKGPFLKPPYIKKLQGNLYELRLPGKVKIRIFCTIFKEEYYLIHAFKKKSPKIPARELKTAIDRLRELI